MSKSSTTPKSKKQSDSLEDVLGQIQPSKAADERMQNWDPHTRTLDFVCGDNRKVVRITSKKRLRKGSTNFRTKLTPTVVQKFRKTEKAVSGQYILRHLVSILEQHVQMPDARQYLLIALWTMATYLYSIFNTIQETLARVGEINRMTWDDVNLEDRSVILYTRKKKGGHLTPRSVPMTGRLFEILSRRYQERDPSKPWVFWHTYWSSKTGERLEGPYTDRKLIMRSLCKKAGVRYFRFHALRHSGASVMEKTNVSIGSIQRILGRESRLTTEIYLHSIGEAERDAMAKYELARKVSHTESHTTGVGEGCESL